MAASAAGSKATAPSAPMPARTAPTSSRSPSGASAPAISSSSSRPRSSSPSRSMMSRLAVRGRAGARMPGVRLAVAEPEPAALPERLGDAAADDDAAERQVAARHALGERDHVGTKSEAMGRQPRPEPAEGADHGVDDGAARRCGRQSSATGLEVARKRQVRAGADHGLGEDGRDASPARAARTRPPTLRPSRAGRGSCRGRAGPCPRGWRRSHRCSSRARAFRGSPACGRSGGCDPARRWPRSSAARAWRRCRSRRRRRSPRKTRGVVDDAAA